MTLEEKKELKRVYDIEYRKKNKQRLKENSWYKRLTPEQRKEYNKKSYAKKDKTKKALEDRQYANKNKDKLNLKKKNWRLANPEKNKESKSKYVKNKLLNDSLYKLKHNITCSIRRSFKRNGYKKESRTYQILGCSFEEFKNYLESKFEPWMNWGNYGNPNGISTVPNTTWDIDHIIPISSAITEEDVIRLNHYTNLQPLCSYTNRWLKSNLVLV